MKTGSKVKLSNGRIADVSPRTSNLVLKTWLPVFPGFYDFPGFYGTWFEMDLENESTDCLEEIAKKGYPLPSDYSRPWKLFDALFEIDFSGYRLAIAKSCVDCIEYEIKEEMKIPGIEALRMEKIVSPKEYNFKNDSIDVEVVFKDFDAFNAWLKTHLSEYSEQWKRYLVKFYSSCSGFIPFYSSCPREWEEETKGFEEIGGHYLGAILNFILTNDENKEHFAFGPYELYCASLEDKNPSEYVACLLPDFEDLPKSAQAGITGLVAAINKGEKELNTYAKIIQGKPESVTRQHNAWRENRAKIEEQLLETLVNYRL